MNVEFHPTFEGIHPQAKAKILMVKRRCLMAWFFDYYNL
jgi:hypothetical protein